MRIAFTIQSLSNSGGIERVVANKANWLAMHNHEVAIITSFEDRSFYRISDKVKIYSLNLPTDSIKGNNLFRPFQKIFRKLKHIWHLRKVLNTLKPEIVSSIHADDFYYLPFINKSSKKIFEYHYVSIEEKKNAPSSIAKKWKGKSFSYLHDYALKKYNAVVFLSKKETHLYSKYKNVYNLPNANTFKVDRQANLEACNVIAIGNLIPLKGFDKLIAMWKTINVKYPQWKLNIFGEGPDRDKLQSQINEFNLGSSVNLRGRSNDVQNELLNSSILVSTSSSESFSMVLLEAQSVGVPCVAFDCPFGPGEIIKNGHTGFLIIPDDNNQFIEKLSILIDNTILRKQLGQNAIVNSKQFDEDAIMNRWLELFEMI